MQKNLNLILRVTTRTQMRFNLRPYTSASNQGRTTALMFAIWQMLSDTSTPSPWKTVALKCLLSFVSVVIGRRHKIRAPPSEGLPPITGIPSGNLTDSLHPDALLCSMTAPTWKSSNYFTLFTTPIGMYVWVRSVHNLGIWNEFFTKNMWTVNYTIFLCYSSFGTAQALKRTHI